MSQQPEQPLQDPDPMAGAPSHLRGAAAALKRVLEARDPHHLVTISYRPERASGETPVKDET